MKKVDDLVYVCKVNKNNQTMRTQVPLASDNCKGMIIGWYKIRNHKFIRLMLTWDLIGKKLRAKVISTQELKNNLYFMKE